MAELKADQRTEQKQSSIVGRDEFEALKGEMQSGMSAIMAQLSAIAQANDGRSRPSRTQEMAEYQEIHERHTEDWEGETLLGNPAFKPLPGYRQMWIRTAIAGESDGSNVARMMNKGFEPRPSDTVPEKIRGSCAIDFEGKQVIGWRGTVLFQISEEKWKKMIARRELQADIMMRGVEENLMRTHDRSQTGFGAPHFTERKRSIEKGRPAESLID
jgi:hypothetical protein